MPPAPDLDPRPAVLRLTFPASPSAVRETLARMMAAMPLAGLSDSERGTAEIVLAEVLNNIAEHAYADKAGLDFTGLNTRDFYERLTCACADRWGLVIELLIDAFVIALDNGATEPGPLHFCLAFTRRTGLREGFSPFSIDSYEKLFEARKIFEIWEKKRSAISI